jgi:probable F420-dependent oxidoreductase
MEVWAGLPADVPLADVPAIARRAEALGFDGVHVAETFHDAFILSHLVISATTRVKVRTSVALAFPRSPMITAYAAWDLQTLGDGRFELGIGTQVKGNIEGRFGVPWSDPVGRIGDYVDALRAIFTAFTTGEALRHEGPHYRLTRLQPYFNPGPSPSGPPPIWLGGIGPKMWRLAGAKADGIVTHPTSSDPLLLQSVCVPAMESGLAEAGRDRSGFGLVVGTSMITGRDEAALVAERERQRQLLAFLYSTPSYRPALELRGLGEVHQRLHRMSLAGAWDDLAAVLTDAVIDELVPCAVHSDLGHILLDRYGTWVDGLRLSITADDRDDDALADVVYLLRSARAETASPPAALVRDRESPK